MPLTLKGHAHKLNVTLSYSPPQTGAREITAVCVFGREARDAELCGARGPLLETVRGVLSSGEFKGEEDDSLLLHASTPDAALRLLLVGAGRREDAWTHQSAETRALRRAAATAARRANEAKARRVAFVLPACDDAPRAARAVAEGAHLGTYENDFYKSADGEDGARAGEEGSASAGRGAGASVDKGAREDSLREFVIVSGEQGEGVRARMSEEIERGRVVAESANWARALADEPGASLPPREFARRAAEMAAEFGLKVESLNAEEVRARGMGGLWGVGQGSDEPPALVVMRYEPEGLSDEDAGGGLIAFVGKGITFDTGGISIKPAEKMEEMKADMAGGAAVLGALRAIAQLKPRRRVIAVVPTAENMPSGKSLKPGDVIRTFAGYTIEVVDTDAEGRLILVDGIAYARSLGATRIVDLATLTGSIIAALGDHRAGLFSNDDAWAREVTRAAERAGEPVWRMPVSDDYKKKIESDIADFKNYGGRPDATGAALLLSKFAGSTPWAHLDIAATAWLEQPTPHAPAGATGTGVRTLVELVCGKEGN